MSGDLVQVPETEMTEVRSPALLRWMRDGTRVRIGGWMAAISIVLGVAAILTLAVIGRWDFLIDQFVVNLGLTAVAFGAVTALALPKQPRNGAVWVLAWSATVSSVAAFSAALTVVLTRKSIPDFGWDAIVDLSPSELPSAAAAASWWLAMWLWLPGFFMLFTLGFLLFPDGRLPSPRWRWVAWLDVIIVAMATFGTAWLFWPTSTVNFGAPSEDQPRVAFLLSEVGYVVLFGLWLLSLVTLVLRYRRSSRHVRSQIRLIAWGATALFFFAIVGAFLPGNTTEVVGLLAGQTVLIATFAAALLKFRLYDIDVVISKSVTYLGLAAVITAVFAAVVAIPTLIIGESDQGGPGLVLPIVATAIVAILFEPIRSRLQRWANRLVYGKRATPHEVLSQLTARLSETGRDSGTNDLARLLAEGTGADSAAVWLQAGDTLIREGVWPVDDSAISSLHAEDLVDDECSLLTPVRHGEEILGALSVTKSRNDPLTPADRELVVDVAGGAGLMLRNIGLNRQLEERAEQVRESRRRLIAAQDSERHRLERDLHDGAQQQVVALKVKLGVAKTLAERAGVEDVISLVSGLADETQHAIDALRAVAHGMYPPLLEAEGLDVALRAVERTAATPLSITTEGLRRYERHVEETVYFCVLEAIERVHMSGAAMVEVTLTDAIGELLVEIDHDGRVTEADLTAVSDRVDAFGGSVAFSEPMQDLARITTRLPMGISALEPA